MKKNFITQLASVAVLLWAGISLTFAQTTYTVNAGGGADFTSISAAISAATSGDIILVSGTITGDGTAPDGIIIDKNLTIMGQGPAITIVQASLSESDAGINQRVFTVNAGVTARIKDLTVRHGYLNTAVNYDGGGGIKNSGTLFIEGCVITRNHVHTQNYQFGGGVLNAGTGSLNIDKTTISSNTSSGWAGGICHGNYGGPGPLVLTNSTLTGNSAPGRAGALLLMICTQNNQITNCTFYGNSSGSYGVLFNDRSSATYTNNTFLNNTCTGGGGAIYLYAGTMNMKNNLIANNAESGGSIPNDFRYQSGTVNDNGYNLIENSANYTFTGTGDITGDQASLNVAASLADNGTFNGTQTIALNTGSVAIDAGNSGMNGSVAVPCKDQRGYFNNGSKDIGAYEFNGSTVVPYAISIETDPVDATACAGQSASFTVASSNGLYYQWVYNGTDIPGANSATLTLNGITMGSAGEYYCRVSDDCVASNSASATLSVYSTPGCVPPVDILELDPSSYSGSISVSANQFIGVWLNPLTCTDVDVTYLGADIDAASPGGGTVRLGLYEGDNLVYQTGDLTITGGVDETIGEAIPSGTINMQSGVQYKLGLIYSGTNDMYVKYTNAPAYLGIAEYSVLTTLFNTTTTYPVLPDPFSFNGGWGFAASFDIQGVANSANTSASITEVACNSYTSPSGNYVWTTSGTYMDTIPNAAGCDSVLTIDLTINYSTTGTDVQTACDSYTWIDGNTYTASNNTATWTLTNAAGCDSLVTLDLTINYSTTGTDVQTACDSYTWIDGNTYTASNNTATWTLTNAAGCDSLVTLDLTINYSTTGTDVQTACDSYTWIDGNTYTASNNSATWTLTNAAGCDSLVTLDLTINYSTTGTDVQTACDSYTWIDGNTYTASNNSATWTLTNAAGCDSLVMLDLTINYSTTGTDVQTACDSYTWIDGNTYTASNNTATWTVTNAAGCDSLVTLDLTINYSSTGTDVQTACDSYTWIDGNTYTASNNSATWTLTNAAGCDSLVTLDLTINYSTAGTDVQTACDSYTWIDGNTYTASNNTATWTLTNAVGCDSLVTLDLTINYSTAGTDVQTACDSYTWIDGNTYTASNNSATWTLTNAAGCDSLVTLDLTINYSTTGTDVQTACDSYTWIDGNTYTASNNTATWTLTNAVGCDSLVTLDLTINYSTAGTDVQTACDSYTWIDGNTYTASNNTATWTLTNAAGCDSLVTLDLTVNYSNTGTDVQTACDSYTWIDGNTYTASNNTATWTVTNAAGCDSLVTLDLTINYSSTGTDVQTACDSYTWIDGNTYTASNNTATWTLTNAVGCDSLVTLDLTINYSTAGTDVQTACDSYTWIDGNTYTASNNTATWTLTNAVGCDSVVTLDLTINNSVTYTDVITACDSYTWIDGNTYTSSNNAASWMLTTAGGCDSLVLLDLTINNSTTDTVNASGIDSYTLNGETFTSSGTYTQILTNAAGCDSVIVLNLELEYTGLEEVEGVQISVYPNPAFDHINVTSTMPVSTGFTLLDIQGRIVMEGRIEGVETSIGLTGLESGAYILQLPESKQSVRIVKQ